MQKTMKDIQKATGLGLATISKYINGGAVRPANKALLDRAIEELGYKRNEYARALKTSRSRTVGVVIPELSNQFSTTIVSAVEDGLRKLGYAVIVCDCRSDPALERQAVEFLIAKGVDGILNMPVAPTGSYLEAADASGVPVVLIDRLADGFRGSAVVIDNRQAAHDAAAHLMDLGHIRIGLICGLDSVFTFRERRAGWRQALSSLGADHNKELDIMVPHTVNGGYEGMKRLLESAPDATAVLVANYEMTLGAVIAANETGVRLPESLSFIGFDNLELSKVMTPRLTTVAQPMEAIAEAATDLLLETLNGSGGSHRTITLQATLVHGTSTKRINP